MYKNYMICVYDTTMTLMDVRKLEKIIIRLPFFFILSRFLSLTETLCMLVL